jgi:DNA polymerase sigma
LIINFLQTRKPPILPSLHQRAKKSGGTSETSFDDNIEAMANFGSKNKSTLGQLLFEFYRYYGFEFKYDDLVVSVRQGRVLTRKEKGWASNSRDGQWKFCIEEPFNISRNLGNSADSTAFRGIHLEIRRAFGHLAKLELDKMVEKYEFPPEEKSSSIFKRPAPTKAVLSAVPPNSNKGKGSMRFNRNGTRGGGHPGASNRRASSSAIGRNNGPFSPNQVPSEFLSSDGMNGVQWVQNWQMLGMCSANMSDKN